jgi:hypothetical protein
MPTPFERLGTTIFRIACLSVGHSLIPYRSFHELNLRQVIGGNL